MKRLLLSAILFLFLYNSYAQAAFTSSNLPIVVINTNGQDIPDDPKITADMGIINNGSSRNNLTDPFNEYNGKIGIEIRGQSSQMFPMKSYSIELRDSNGESVDAPLFGLPKESDWVLYAPYTDKTLMRNVLAYNMSNRLGHWASHCRFVEVMLNGNYVGVYVFIERIKRDEGRVNIKKLSSKDTTGDAVTGGYLFSIDKGANGWVSPYHPNNDATKIMQYSYVYPKEEDIETQQKEYIKSYVDSFENALAGNNFQDVTGGFRKYVDEASFIDYLIVNEISRNLDAYRLSSYFYKDRNSINAKIIAGPVWDYDLAFRNADYCNGSNTDGWAYDFNNVCSDDYWQVPFWWNRFKQDTAFQSHLLCRWKEVRHTVLSNQSLFGLIDSAGNVVSEAQVRHFTQWPILGQYVWPNPQPIPTSYAGEISTLKNWLTSRLAWLDANMPNTGICATPLPQIKGTMAFITSNPVINFGNAVVQSTILQKISVRMVDMAGRTVYSTSLSAQPGNNSLPNRYSLQSLRKGVYIVQLMNDRGDKQVTKIVKQ